MTSFIDVGRRIKQYRMKAGMTQAGLAELLGVTDKYISQIERGKATVSLQRLDDIAHCIQTTSVCLISDLDIDTPEYLNAEITEKTGSFSPTKKLMLLDIIDTLNKYDIK